MRLGEFVSKLLYHYWINCLSISSYMCLRTSKVQSLGEFDRVYLYDIFGLFL